VIPNENAKYQQIAHDFPNFEKVYGIHARSNPDEGVHPGLSCLADIAD
jgi:hypothetical protein